MLEIVFLVVYITIILIIKKLILNERLVAVISLGENNFLLRTEKQKTMFSVQV